MLTSFLVIARCTAKGVKVALHGKHCMFSSHANEGQEQKEAQSGISAMFLTSAI